MRISGANGGNPSAGQAGLQQTDSVSRDIQKQIANKQKELQNLSSDQHITMEEKAKKRQELLKEISDLQNQLRQHQIEQRREAMNAKKDQEKDNSMEETTGGKRKRTPNSREKGMSQAGMKAMISADSAMKQAQVQGSTASEMENRASILKTEIKLDKSRGADVSKKEEELAQMEEGAAKANQSQIRTLDAANEELRDSQKAETEEDRQEELERKGEKDSEQDKEPGKVVDLYL